MQAQGASGDSPASGDSLAGRRILLVIGGGIAAYKALELIRRLRDAGAGVVPVLTPAGGQFVTPLSVAALAGHKVYRDLFDLTEEAEMGHIRLSRAADLIVVAPATADLMARMAGGRADDLAATLLLATDAPVLLAPAMNVRMWDHPATRRNLATLQGDGIRLVGPEAGPMACGEFGPGRMAEVPQILAAIRAALDPGPARPAAGAMGGWPAAGAMGGGPLGDGAVPEPEPVEMPGPQPVPGPELSPGPLAGRHVLVTSGPTHEPIDPVRYIANRSSGAQGSALAAALRDLGARVTFVTGPAAVAPPEGVAVVAVETAAEMLAAVEAALPADAAVFAAAVADWRVEGAGSRKIKKDAGGRPPELRLAETPDILAAIARRGEGRPRLVVGFAAETDDLLAHASAKLARKGCDWIVANDVRPETGIMGGPENAVTLVSAGGAEPWPRLPKAEVARRLAQRIAGALA